MKLRVTFALFACLAFTTCSAQAQMSEGEKKAAARAAYAEGVDLQDKGKPAEALTRFEAAQVLFDAPTHLLHIAECQTLTGKLVEASETYETLIRKPLPPGSPEAFVQAQEQGKAELAALRPRIPTMRVTIKPEPQTLQSLQISVNGKQMPPELVGIARPVNPGAYKLTASATGWGTSTPTNVEVQEREQKNVELTLQQGVGAAGPIVVVPPPSPSGAQPSPNGAPPPPYEQQPPKPKPKEGPSTTGLLLGVRGGVVAPGGDVDKTTKFANYASSGGGIGFDVIGRVAKLFLLGGTLEIASLGSPNSRAIDAGSRAEFSTRSVYYGLFAGIMPNVDKVTFVADAGFGHRAIHQTRTVTNNVTSAERKSEETYEGLEIALNAGISFPAGPIRIVPKAGFSFGQFDERTCGTGAVGTLTGCNASSPQVNTAGHTMFNIALALYYHLDLAKKPAATTATATQ